MKMLLLFLMMFVNTAYAVNFDIYQADYKPLNLAMLVDIAPEYEDDEALFYQVVTHDLASSQSFKVQNPIGFIADTNESFIHVAYDDWRIIATDTLVLCRLRRGENQWVLDVQLHAPFEKKQLAEKHYQVAGNALRNLAHQVSNFIYQAVLKIPGHFSSHVIYVTKHGDKSDLVYMDQDGANQQVIGRNFTLLLSPDWSPNSRYIALNTYVGNRPRLEFFDLKTGKRDIFASFKGLNSTPEYSPDGKYIAATLSKSGNPDIYIYSIQQRTWRALTHNHALDTTPTWSPDGQWIAFASSRVGSPEIFRIPVAGGKAEQVSLEGKYNTSPVWSPKGDRIAFITKKEWSFALATARMDGTGLRYLATGDAIESPTWSPNGQMILYSAEDHGVRRIYRVPSWGGTPVAITPAGQDASDPAWSRQ
ncbi:MAG: Tol-Pal system beta propeller repeat protein TolB [Mariprofundaceae bacterium]|nr:Tol-Pal system beta propeller repeat protein TolB [Mariprofundaceae bacterium]